MDILAVQNKFIKTIKQGGIVLAPSDTCYGLYCDAFNEKSINKLFEIKQRDKGKPVAMMVSNKEMAKRYVEWDDQVEKLWNEYTKKPYTLILPRKLDKKIPGQMGFHIGIRLPNYSFITEIIKKLDSPIIATSANKSGSPVHYSYKSVIEELEIEKINYTYDAGEIEKNRPSTLIIWNRNEGEIEKIKRS